MRPLLLLLLTFLIPLQLLAATGQSQPQQAVSSCAAPLADHVHVLQSEATADLLLSGSEVQATMGDEDGEEPSSLQGDLEDPTLPTRIATPPAIWQPFPHAFLAPLSWPSYLRDQLRPPPLA